MTWQWDHGKKWIIRFRQSRLLWTDRRCYKLLILHFIDMHFISYLLSQEMLLLPCCNDPVVTATVEIVTSYNYYVCICADLQGLRI